MVQKQSGRGLLSVALTLALAAGCQQLPHRGALLHDTEAPQLGASQAAEKTYRLTVNAGDWDRKDTVVSFSLPSSPSRATVNALRGDGKSIPLQVDAQGHAWFVELNLKKGTSKTYETASASDRVVIQVNREGSRSEAEAVS